MFIIELENDPSPLDEGILLKGINEEDRKLKDVSPVENFALFLRTPRKDICGGISAVTYYGCLFIELLWVAPELRDQGWGSKLLHEALWEASKRKCTFVNVHTMDWQALPFYLKHGFFIEFVSRGYQDSAELYVLRKELLPDSIRR